MEGVWPDRVPVWLSPFGARLVGCYILIYSLNDSTSSWAEHWHTFPVERGATRLGPFLRSAHRLMGFESGQRGNRRRQKGSPACGCRARRIGSPCPGWGNRLREPRVPSPLRDLSDPSRFRRDRRQTSPDTIPTRFRACRRVPRRSARSARGVWSYSNIGLGPLRRRERSRRSWPG